ncbi:hypothetical protein CJF30_00009548 [Rutstroemia sp. NJR-2017a BBW]|nr:hypothetical protein CJF30_00009548 [Rutstroemia sp. NJR-2017a BBW]
MSNNSMIGPPYGPVLNGTMVIVFWEYRPSDTAALAFVALFALLTVAHIVMMFMYRAWCFIPFILGGISETFGYYERYQAHSQPATLGPWILQNLLILVSAPFLAATVYMSLGRLTSALGGHRSRWLSKLYVLLDFVVLISQLAGTVMPASGDAKMVVMAAHIILAGLIVQVVALGGFIVIAWKAYTGLRNGAVEVMGVKWENYFKALMVVTGLIVVRSLVRMVEYIQGSDGEVDKEYAEEWEGGVESGG